MPPVTPLKCFVLFFVTVGWGGGSKTICYDWAVKRVADVENVVAEFLDFLIGEDQRMWKKITIAGHSRDYTHQREMLRNEKADWESRFLCKLRKTSTKMFDRSMPSLSLSKTF